MNYHKDMTVQEILYSNDMVFEIFERYGLPCCTCGGAASETLEIATRVHGCNLDDILMDLNELTTV